MKLLQRIALICFLSTQIAFAASTDAPKPFVIGSMQEIISAHHGKLLIINFWATDCAYCQEEFSTLTKIAKLHPRLAMVFVSVDPPQNAALVNQVLTKNGFDPTRAWLFADNYVERLRFDIDRKWQGELPRTYLIDESGKMKGISGKLTEAKIEQWISGDKK
ncbi:MAG: TlpA disulfide reductase family protein [Pseudomonadota bacterium]